MQHTVRTVEAGEIDARGLANTAHGAACSIRGALLHILFIPLARAVERWVSEFEAQNLTNTAWAFATVSRPDEKLFAALARTVER